MSNSRKWTTDQAHCRIGKITFRRSASSRILTEFNVTTNRLLALARRASMQGEGSK